MTVNDLEKIADSIIQNGLDKNQYVFVLNGQAEELKQSILDFINAPGILSFVANQPKERKKIMLSEYTSAKNVRLKIILVD